MSKGYGEGIYGAYRQNGVLHITAKGMKPYLQTKVTLEELPFLIYPPQFALFFETTGIASPVELPFDIAQAFPHYPNVPTVTVVDRTGHHTISIEDRETALPLSVDVSDKNYVVYQQIGTDRYLIAKSDALVLAIYYKVFGPDSYENCQQYVASHGIGSAPLVHVVPGTLKAWIDKQPVVGGAGPKLIVIVEAIADTNWQINLVEQQPQGINRLVKLLTLDIVHPGGPFRGGATKTFSLRYEEAPAGHPYTDVTLLNGGESLSVKVSAVQ